jgi:hypothetical protein
LEQRLTELESRLATMESTAIGGAADAYVNAPSSVVGECAVGLTAGGELLFLKAYQSEGLTTGFPCQAAPRVWLGMATDRGWGVRARWFDYHAAAPTDDRWLAEVGATTLDVEVTGAFQVGNLWSGTLSGGVRYAELRETWGAAGGPHDDSTGWGPVLGLELQRQLSERLALFAQGRESLLFGSAVTVGTAAADDVFSVTELQLGAQWHQPWYGSTSWFVRGAWEGQFWANGSGAVGHAALGLMGGILAIGIQR